MYIYIYIHMLSTAFILVCFNKLFFLGLGDVEEFRASGFGRRGGGGGEGVRFSELRI